MRLYSGDMATLFEHFQVAFERRAFLDKLLEDRGLGVLSDEGILKNAVKYYHDHVIPKRQFTAHELVDELRDFLECNRISPSGHVQEQCFEEIRKRSSGLAR